MTRHVLFDEAALFEPINSGSLEPHVYTNPIGAEGFPTDDQIELDRLQHGGADNTITDDDTNAESDVYDDDDDVDDDDDDDDDDNGRSPYREADDADDDDDEDDELPQPQPPIRSMGNLRVSLQS